MVVFFQTQVHFSDLGRYVCGLYYNPVPIVTCTTSFMLHTELPGKIRSIRRFLNLNQIDLAERLGIPIQAYGKIERGKTNISLVRLQQIALVFGFEPTQLLQSTEAELLHMLSKRCA